MRTPSWSVVNMTMSAFANLATLCRRAWRLSRALSVAALCPLCAQWICSWESAGVDLSTDAVFALAAGSGEDKRKALAATVW